jgi:PRTRC genetic system ThiF family protein
MLVKLLNLHRAMIALGHPHGLDVLVVDPDVVSPANIGRQNFYPGDVGSFKADVLVSRANMALENTVWKSSIDKLTTNTSLHGFDIVIGAVDNRAARLAILRGLEGTMSGVRYWLDMGNRKSDGQVILGEVTSRRKKLDEQLRLPHAAELYPEIIEPKLEQQDDTPSCSLAEALKKQALLINPVLADFAANILWQLFTKGSIESHGVFVNLESMMVVPLKVDPDVWDRFGVVRDGRRHKIVRESVKRKRQENVATA